MMLKSLKNDLLPSNNNNNNINENKNEDNLNIPSKEEIEELINQLKNDKDG